MMEHRIEKQFRYSVLYQPGVEQQTLKNLIEEHLPKEKGEAFIPRMELYKRGEKKAVEIAIFPGYVFLYTALNRKEVHEMLMDCRIGLKAAFRELALWEKQRDDPEALYREGDKTGKDRDAGDAGRERGTGMESWYDLSDLDREETEFLDMLRRENGLLAMSYGYEENRKYHVMEGPLQAFEDKIQKVDKHNRKAFLLFEIHGRQARAGFECKPKAHWFPQEETQIAMLSDGTEVDLEELKRKLTTTS